MISLIMALGGGLFRIVPEIFKFFNAKADRAQELAMATLQIERDKLAGAQRVAEIVNQGDATYDTAAMSALEAAIVAQGKPSGVKWIDGLSSSVRPVLTYWWCVILYTGVKVATITMLWQAHGVDIGAAITVVWTEFDAGVAGSMINFWFLDRVLKGRPTRAAVAA